MSSRHERRDQPPQHPRRHVPPGDGQHEARPASAADPAGHDGPGRPERRRPERRRPERSAPQRSAPQRIEPRGYGPRRNGPQSNGPLAQGVGPTATISTAIDAENLAAEVDESTAPGGGVDDSDQSVMRTGGSIAIATLISRITGFIRTVLVLALLGGAVSSAFQAAYVLPNMIAEVVLGAVLTAIVIPVLVRAENEDEDGGASFINRIFTLSLAILGVATVAALIAAPLLTALNVGDGKVDRDVTTALAYLLLPEILFYGLSALFMAILNMKNIFKPGAWAPVLNNIVQIITLVLYVIVPGDITINPLAMSDPKLLVLGVGTTIGVVVQAAILLPFLKRAGVKLRLEWGIDARLRRFGNMALAIVFYVLILQVGLVITYRIAAAATDSGIAVYATAWQLLQLPYGVLGVTILTAIMPRLSRNAAAEDTDAVVNDMSLATRLTMLALVPTVAYMTFFGPAIGVAIFNFKDFAAHDASQLGSVLSWGAFTLIPYAMTLVQLRVFYAREDAWTPTFMVLGITIVKVVSSYLGPVLFSDPDLVVRWLSLSNGLGYLVGAIVGQYLLYRALGRERMRNVLRTTMLTVGVSLGVTAAVWVVVHVTPFAQLSTDAGKIGALAYLAITGVVVLAVIYLFLVGLRIPDMVAISDSVVRLLGRFIPGLARRSNDDPGAPGTARPQPDITTMTVQFPRISTDEALPYSGQVEVRRRFDRGSASWQEYGVSSGGAAGETAVLPRIGGPVHSPGTLPSQQVTRAVPRSPQSPPSASPAGPPRTGMPPMTQKAAAPTPPRGPRLVPGAAIAGGRYRLLEAHGGTQGMQFWRAQDSQLGREVGLTFVDPDQAAATDADEPTSPVATLNRTRRLGQLQMPGVARVLDVVRGASGGVVVSEWIPGSSLAEVSADSPSAAGAARAVRTLAAAAEAAHRAGAALCIDHPDRIRISADGDAVLAFPAVLADADRAADVRGLGAVLYALLLNRWPLADPASGAGAVVVTAQAKGGQVGGFDPAAPDLKKAGRPIAPAEVKPEIPFEISAVAVRALDDGPSIRTAGTVQHILDQASVVDLATDVLPRIDDDRVPVSVAPISRTRKERLLGEGDAGKRNSALLIGTGLFLVFLVIALILWLANPFGGDQTTDVDSFLGESTATSAPSSEAPGAQITPVIPAGVTVFDPEGEADQMATQNLDNLLSGGSPSWKTSQYRGTEKFGGLKDGLGLMFQLADGTSVRSVEITTTTPGFTVEFRSTDSAEPNLNATSVVGSGTVDKRVTRFTLTSPAEGSYLLIWIPELAQVEPGRYQAIIQQITFAGS